MHPATVPLRAETLQVLRLIGEFEPMLRRVFAQPRNSIYKAAMPAA